MQRFQQQQCPLARCSTTSPLAVTKSDMRRDAFALTLALCQSPLLVLCSHFLFSDRGGRWDNVPNEDATDDDNDDGEGIKKPSQVGSSGTYVVKRVPAGTKRGGL